MTVWLSPQTLDARLQAVLDDADVGPDPASIYYYTAANAPAAPGGTPAGPHTVKMVLTKPCGAIVAHQMVLTQDDPMGDMIAATGAVTFGRLVAGDGHVVLEGDITDDAGAGFFKISGTAGTALYAGARSILGTVGIT